MQAASKLGILQQICFGNEGGDYKHLQLMWWNMLLRVKGGAFSGHGVLLVRLAAISSRQP